MALGFDEWTVQVTNRLNEQKAAIAELTALCKVLVKWLHDLEQQQATQANKEEAK